MRISSQQFATNGKTMFAFLCMDVFAREHPDGRFIILVPTITLLDRWYVSLQEDFGVVLFSASAPTISNNT